MLIKPIEHSDIKVIELKTGNRFNNWRLVKAANSPLNGMLGIAVFHEKAGQYFYKVEIKDMGTVAIDYMISQEKTDNPCRVYSYPMTGFQSTDHDFEHVVYQYKQIPNFIKVYLP